MIVPVIYYDCFNSANKVTNGITTKTVVVEFFILLVVFLYGLFFWSWKVLGSSKRMKKHHTKHTKFHLFNFKKKTELSNTKMMSCRKQESKKKVSVCCVS